MSRSFFTVDEFSRTNQNIIVTITDDESTTDIRVSRHKFEGWLDKQGKLTSDTGLTYSDDKGRNKPVIATVSIVEYYNSDDVKTDLHEYIMLTNGENFHLNQQRNFSNQLSELSN